MKKLYSTQNLVKAVSLGTAIAALLSSVSPVFAANLAITGQNNLSTNGANVMYIHGSHGSVVLAGDDDYCGVDNVKDRGGKQQASIPNNNRITAEEQYNRFINNKDYNGRHPYGTTTEQVNWIADSSTDKNGGYMGSSTGGIFNAMPEAYGIYSFATGCGSAATGNYSTVFGAGATAKAGGAQAFGVSALASGEASVAMGVGSEASGKSAVAFGGLAQASGLNAVALGARTKAGAEYTVAIGSQAEARASGAIAIGGSEPVEDEAQDRFVVAYEKDAIAIGSHAHAEKMYSIAIGSNAQVRVEDGVAIGGGSVSLTEKGVLGYDPATNESSTDTSITWKSTAGAFSIGEVGGGDGKGQLTRQITGVAAGTADTDAVNVAQLKALRDLAAGEWKLSVDGKNETSVKGGSVVDFSVKNDNAVGKDNLKIEKDNTNIKFTLNDQLELTSVTTGGHTMSGDGFFIADNGPRITVDGIDAGNEKITGVMEGEDDTDAVNYKQLNEVKGLISKAGGWKFSVNGGDATDVNAGSTLDFVGVKSENYDNRNIKIVKEGNAVTFDLAEFIEVKRVQTGKTELSDNGLVITGGARMTTGGIHAGNKKVTGVEKGTNDNDAVNFAQLNEIKNQIAGNSLVKWDENQKLITIGAEKDGMKIDITGSEGDRTISGVKAAVEDNDAVNKKQLEDTIADITDSIKNNILVKQNGGENSLITVGKATGGTEINIANKSGDARTISGVKAAVNSDEAVNKEQLDGQISDITDIINNIKVDSGFAVRYDKNADGTVNYNSVTLGGDKNKGPVALLNVKDGKIVEDSHDAINGGQINKISEDIAKFFGGDASFKNGTYSGPKYTLSTIFEDGEKAKANYYDVGSALKGLDGNVNSVNNRLTNVVNNFNQKIEGFSKDALLWSNEQQAFVALHGPNGEKTNSKITLLKNGDITEDSTDAINGSQLFKTNQTVSNLIETFNAVNKNISDYFGGGADVLADKAPAYTIQGKTHNDVGSAFGAVDASITNISNQITNVTKNSLVKQEGGSEAIITIGKETGGTKISIANNKGSVRIISGVSGGKITADSTEAVNGAQLFETNGAIQDLYDNFDNISTNISNYFGGSADVSTGKAPTYTIQGKAHNDVGSAFNDVDASITDIYSQISNVTQNSLVKQEGGSEAIITIGKATGGTKISIADKNGNARTISDVKDGTLSRTSTDAINGSQLFKTNQTVSNLIETFNEVHENISKYFGGSTDVLSGIEPAFLINGKAYNNVTDAFTGVNISIKNLDDKIIEMKENNLVQQEGINGIITIGAKTAGTKISVAGVGNAARTISGVKAAEKGDEAVNKDQLDKTIEKISNDIEVANAAAVLYDKNEDGSINYGSVTLGGNKNNGPVALLNVKDGKIAANSTDAITGNQLYLMSNQLAAYFGGGAKYENGKWTAPNFKISQVNADGNVKEQTYQNVADAFGGINSGMTNINNRIDDVINKVDSDALKWNKEKKAYDAGRNGQPSKIINVADGKIEKGSKDAVNGGQLWETNERITGVEKDVEHISNRVDNISNTIADIGDIVVNIENKVDNIDDKVNNVAEDAVRYDRNEKGEKINKITLAGGDPGEPVIIDNVADGRIEKDSKEAVNGGQLHDYTKEQMKIILDESKHYTDQRVNNIVIDAIDDAVERANHYTNMKFEALNYNIENVRKEARQAAAIGLAVSNLRYSDIPGKLSVGFGSGLWRSQSAFAFGAGYTSESGSIRSNISVTTSGGHWGVGAGFNMILN